MSYLAKEIAREAWLAARSAGNYAGGGPVRDFDAWWQAEERPGSDPRDVRISQLEAELESTRTECDAVLRDAVESGSVDVRVLLDGHSRPSSAVWLRHRGGAPEAAITITTRTEVLAADVELVVALLDYYATIDHFDNTMVRGNLAKLEQKYERISFLIGERVKPIHATLTWNDVPLTAMRAGARIRRTERDPLQIELCRNDDLADGEVVCPDPEFPDKVMVLLYSRPRALVRP